jgi:hypothetical protein
MRLGSSMSISGNGICVFGNSFRGSRRLLGEGTEVCPQVSEKKKKKREKRAVLRYAKVSEET